MRGNIGIRKIIYPVTIIVILALGTAVFLNIENLWSRLEEELVLAIEQAVQDRIAIGDISLFPFNKIVLNDVQTKLSSGGEGQDAGELYIESVVLTVKYHDLFSRKDWLQKIEITEVEVKGYHLQVKPEALSRVSRGAGGVLSEMPPVVADWEGEITLAGGEIFLWLPRDLPLENPLRIKNLDGTLRKEGPMISLVLEGKQALFAETGIKFSGSINANGYQASISLKDIKAGTAEKLLETARKLGWLNSAWKDAVHLWAGAFDLQVDISSREEPLKAAVDFNGLQGTLDKKFLLSMLPGGTFSGSRRNSWQNSLQEILGWAPETLSITLRGSVTFSSYSFKFSQIEGELDSVAFQLNGSYFPADGYSDLNIQLDDLSVSELTSFIFGNINGKLNMKARQAALELIGERQADLRGRLQLQLLGSISSPRLKGELIIPGNTGNSPGGNLSRVKFSVEEESVHIQELAVNSDAGRLEMKGSIRLDEKKDYYLDLKLEGADLGRLQRAWSKLSGTLFPTLRFPVGIPDINGQTSIYAIITGQGLKGEHLNIIGSLRIGRPVFGNFKGDLLEASFGVTDRQVMFSSGFCTGPLGAMSFKGKIDFNGDYQFSIDHLRGNTRQVLEQFKVVEKLSAFEQIEVIANLLPPIFEFSGTLTGTEGQPVLEGELFLAEAGWFKLAVSPGMIEVKEGKITALPGESECRGFYKPGTNRVMFDFQLKDLSTDRLEAFVDRLQGFSLPGQEYLNQFMSRRRVVEELTFHLEGPADNFYSHLSVKLRNSRPSELDDLNLKSLIDIASEGRIDLSWFRRKDGSEGDLILVNSLALHLPGGETITGRGRLFPGTNLVFYGEDFGVEEMFYEYPVLAARYPQFSSLKGDVDFKITVRETSPEISGTFHLQDLNWADLSLGEGLVLFEHNRGELIIDEYSLVNGEFQVRGQGRLKEDLTSWSLQADIRGPIPPDISPYLPEPVASLVEGEDLVGTVTVRSGEDSLESDLQLTLGELEIAGSISSTEGMDIKMKGIVALEKLLQNMDLPLDLKARSSIEGYITGDLDQPAFTINHFNRGGSFNGREINYLQGKLLLEEGRLYIYEDLSLGEGNILHFDGLLPWKPQQEMDLKLKGEFTDTQKIFNTLPRGLKELKAAGRVSLDITGTYTEPQFKGKVVLENALVHLEGYPYAFSNINGTILVDNQKCQLLGLEADYGGGLVFIRGAVDYRDYSAPEMALSFWGQNIPFVYGSVNILADGVVNLTGDYRRPLLSGELRVHNGSVKLPWEWPVPEEMPVKFQYNLVLRPGRDLYLEGEGLQIPIEDGELIVDTTSGSLALGGELKTSRGYVLSYNNRFRVIQGSASFMKYISLIPYLNFIAETEVEDTLITVYLHGPANNLACQLESDPPKTEQEILNLLSSRGGIPSLLQGDFEQALNLELWRIFTQELRTEVVDRIERSLKEIFRLDLVDIGGGLFSDERISIHLGKYLQDGLYLNYSQTLTENPEQTIGFELKVHDMIMIEGSFSNTGDMRFGIHTELSF